MAVPNSPWLSVSEREFLEAHLNDAIRLHLGDLRPAGRTAVEFVEVLLGRRNPSRALEFLYLRFLGERGIQLNGSRGQVRRVLHCVKCGGTRDLNRVLWFPETKRCQKCQPGFVGGRRHAESVRRVARSKQPRDASWSSDSIPWAQRFSRTRSVRPKLYMKGGFADYDYDKISPHGIPRKKRD